MSDYHDMINRLQDLCDRWEPTIEAIKQGSPDLPSLPRLRTYEQAPDTPVERSPVRPTLLERPCLERPKPLPAKSSFERPRTPSVSQRPYVRPCPATPPLSSRSSSPTPPSPRTCRYCHTKFSSGNELFRHLREGCSRRPLRTDSRSSDVFSSTNSTLSSYTDGIPKTSHCKATSAPRTCRHCYVQYPTGNALFKHLRAGCEAAPVTSPALAKPPKKAIYALPKQAVYALYNKGYGQCRRCGYGSSSSSSSNGNSYRNYSPSPAKPSVTFSICSYGSFDSVVASVNSEESTDTESIDSSDKSDDGISIASSNSSQSVNSLPYGPSPDLGPYTYDSPTYSNYGSPSEGYDSGMDSYSDSFSYVSGYS